MLNDSKTTRKRKPISFLFFYFLVTLGIATGMWFWLGYVAEKTYVLKARFTTKPIPLEYAPIMLGNIQIGYVGDAKHDGDLVKVDLHIYKGYWIRSNNLLAHNPSVAKKLIVLDTSYFSKDMSAASEGEELLGINLKGDCLDPDQLVDELWQNNFEGLACKLKIDEIFLRSREKVPGSE